MQITRHRARDWNLTSSQCITSLETELHPAGVACFDHTSPIAPRRIAKGSPGRAPYCRCHVGATSWLWILFLVSTDRYIRPCLPSFANVGWQNSRSRTGSHCSCGTWRSRCWMVALVFWRRLSGLGGLARFVHALPTLGRSSSIAMLVGKAFDACKQHI